MFGRVALSLALLATLGAAPPPSPVQLPPAAANAAFTPAALAAACGDKDGWADPAPPAHIYGNTWYVGTCGITALLVTTAQGHILVDAGVPEAAPLVAANIEKLGFSLHDVRWIVGSHEHFDHAGGIPELKRRTGAKVAGIAPWAKVMASGQPDKRDPQYDSLVQHPIEKTMVDRILRSGGKLALGDATLTATATLAHSPGSTSWTWKSCDGQVCRTITYADSASVISADEYIFVDHPKRISDVRLGLKRIGALDCGILVTPHPSASDLFGRMKSGLTTDAKACAAYALQATARAEARFAAEEAMRAAQGVAAPQ